MAKGQTVTVHYELNIFMRIKCQVLTQANRFWQPIMNAIHVFNYFTINRNFIKNSVSGFGLLEFGQVIFGRTITDGGGVGGTGT